MSSFDVVEIKLASDVADAGTFTVGYPAGRNPGDYEGGSNNRIVSNKYGELTQRKGDITLSFDAGNVVITNATGGTLVALTTFFVELDRIGDDSRSAALANPGKMVNLHTVAINLGAPDTADANGYVESQDLTSAGAYSVDTTFAAALIAAALSSGADVPRNVVAAWTTTAVATVTGTDEYGEVISEVSASGTTMATKKAFKTVTDFTISTNITSLTVGTGDILGLPVFLVQVGDVLQELEDGAAPTAGTLVKGDLAKATTSTGDVRGTYDPNSACNGALAFQLLVALSERTFKGVAQV